MFILIVKSIIELDYHGYKQNCGTNSGLIQCSDIIKDNTKNLNQIIRGTITQTHFEDQSQLLLSLLHICTLTRLNKPSCSPTSCAEEKKKTKKTKKQK